MIDELLKLSKEAVRVGLPGPVWKTIAIKCYVAAAIIDDPNISLSELATSSCGNSVQMGRELARDDSDVCRLFELWPGSLEAYNEVKMIIERWQKYSKEL